MMCGMSLPQCDRNVRAIEAAGPADLRSQCDHIYCQKAAAILKSNLFSSSACKRKISLCIFVALRTSSKKQVQRSDMLEQLLLSDSC